MRTTFRANPSVFIPHPSAFILPISSFSFRRTIGAMISEGSAFPNFSLQDQHGKTVTLNDLKGQKAVLFFYPKDDTPG